MNEWTVLAPANSVKCRVSCTLGPRLSSPLRGCKTHLQRFLTISRSRWAIPALLSLSSRVGADDTKTVAKQFVLTGQAAFTDAAHESPGVRRHLTVADLPAPAPDQSVDNGPTVVPRPAKRLAHRAQGLQGGALRHRPRQSPPDSHRPQRRPLPGRKRDRQDQGLSRRWPGRQAAADLRLRHRPAPALRHRLLSPRPQSPGRSTSATPTKSSASPTTTATSKPRGPMENIADLPGGGRLRGGGHWTRDLVFSKDGSKLFASVGSHSNVDDPDTHPEEFHRADVLEFTPEGKFVKIYAWGIRNCVGEAINPITGELWCSTNERDALGNNLVPDYITHVQEGGFYGWPWWYMGGHQDPAPCRQASRAAVEGHHARHHPATPLRLAGDDLLRGLAVPRRVQGRRLRCRARLLEPRPAHRL